jgi:hypothetical protein
MIICTDLPASVSPCAAAGIAGANVSADRIAIAVSFDRLGRMRSLARRAYWSMIFSENRYPLFGIML